MNSIDFYSIELYYVDGVLSDNVTELNCEKIIPLHKKNVAYDRINDISVWLDPLSCHIFNYRVNNAVPNYIYIKIIMQSDHIYTCAIKVKLYNYENYNTIHDAQNDCIAPQISDKCYIYTTKYTLCYSIILELNNRRDILDKLASSYIHIKNFTWDNAEQMYILTLIVNRYKRINV